MTWSIPKIDYNIFVGLKQKEMVWIQMHVSSQVCYYYMKWLDLYQKLITTFS